jgi:predicted RNase H-like nuclease (RuvC/YqgF family)
LVRQSSPPDPVAISEEAAEGGDEGGDAAAGGEGGNPMEQLTMVLMTVDAEIKTLYNSIIAELDDEARDALSTELQNLKSISTDLHEILSKLSGLNPEEDAEAIDRLIRREVRSIRNEVKRLLDQCQEKCPGECDSCGAEKIDEVSEKLKDYRANLEDLEEQDAKESIRTDLMSFLTATNTEMTDLLKEKAEKGELDECGTERLEVIDKIKGPLWMMVNITIFGDGATMIEMIDALE